MEQYPHPVASSSSNRLSCRSAPYSGGRCSTQRQKSRASSSSGGRMAARCASAAPAQLQRAPAHAPLLPAGALLCSLLASSLQGGAAQSATHARGAPHAGHATAYARRTHRKVFTVMEPSCTYTPRHAPWPPKACAKAGVSHPPQRRAARRAATHVLAYGVLNHQRVQLLLRQRSCRRRPASRRADAKQSARRLGSDALHILAQRRGRPLRSRRLEHGAGVRAAAALRRGSGLARRARVSSCLASGRAQGTRHGCPRPALSSSSTLPRPQAMRSTRARSSVGRGA